MNRKVVSAPFIQEAIEQAASKEQYIINLKVQCRMREEALRTAESLISAYQKQNQSLRDELKNIRTQLQQKQEKLIFFQAEEHMVKNLEKNILKYSEKVNELLQKNITAEQKIRSLERELIKQKQQRERQRQAIRQKIQKQKKQQNQKKELEGHFHNFLKLADRQSSIEQSPKQLRNSPGKQQSFITAVTREGRDSVQSNIKILEWKLKQKDEEVVILIKRLNDLQDKARLTENQGRRERILTADSIQNFYSGKQNNVSEFLQ